MPSKREGQMSRSKQVPGAVGIAPPLGERYDVDDGRRIMLHRAGTGSPAVVIEAGAGSFGLDYLSMFERCAERTTCVLYDRAGSGWSDPAPSPRGASEITSDLRTALHLAGVDPPYVMVGHSYGGLLVRAFAQRFPEDVVGLVLVDPQAEGIPLPEPDALEAARGMIDELRRNPGVMREWYPALFAEWEKFPPGVGQPLMARHMDPDFAIAGLRDIEDARRVQADVTSGPPLPDIPMTILTGMAIEHGPGLSEVDQRAFNTIKLEAHAALAVTMPQVDHRVLEEAGHMLVVQQPEVVVPAVFDILDRLKVQP